MKHKEALEALGAKNCLNLSVGRKNVERYICAGKKYNKFLDEQKNLEEES